MTLAVLRQSLLVRNYICRSCLKSARRRSVIGRRWFSLNASVDQIKNRLVELTGEGRETSWMDFELPESISKRLIGVEGEQARFETVVRKGYLSKDWSTLVKYYKSLTCLISEDCAVILASFLYNKSKYEDACRVLVDNIPFGSGLITVMVNKLVPALAEHDGQDMVVGNLVYQLCKIGHGMLARQVLLEMGEDIRLVDDALLVLHGENQQLSGMQLAEHLCLSKGIRFMKKGRAKVLKQCQDFPEWTKAVMFKSMFLHLVQRDQDISPVVLAWAARPYLLRQVIRFALDDDKFTDSVCWLLTQTNTLHDADATAIPSLAVDKASLRQIWKGFVKYRKHSRIPLSALHVLSQKALEFEESITLAQIVSMAGGKFPSKHMSKIISKLAWSKKGEYKDDEFYGDNSDIDTGLLSKVFLVTPIKTLQRALASSLHRLNQDVVPGRILWHLVLALQRCQIPMDKELQLAAARAMSKRPYLEQVRYMALSAVPGSAVMALLNQNMTRIAINEPQRLKLIDSGTSADSQLVLSAFKLILDKDTQTTASQVTNLFNTTTTTNDPTPIADGIRDLYTTSAFPSSSAFIKTIHLLMASGKQRLATNLILQVHQQVPSEAFDIFITKALRSQPVLCIRMALWLQTQNTQLQMLTLRRLLVAVAYSWQLTDAQSIRYMTWIMAQLRAQDAKVGAWAATHMVSSVLKRAEHHGGGSRKRLAFVLKVARAQHGIKPEQWQKWSKQLNHMKYYKRGYWSSVTGLPFELYI